VFSASIASFGDYVSSPWVYFTFVAPVAGIYDLTAGVRNVGSNNANSLLRVDFATQPVPEPEGLSLTLAGLGALAFVARRRRTL
jgi:hypothetical protein